MVFNVQTQFPVNATDHAGHGQLWCGDDLEESAYPISHLSLPSLQLFCSTSPGVPKLDARYANDMNRPRLAFC